MRRTLLPLIVALAVVAGGLVLTSAQPTSAHPRECPAPAPAGEAPIPNARAGHGHDEQEKHKKHNHCKPHKPKPTATPRDGQKPTHAPHRSATPTATPSPAPTPALTPSPIPVPGADVKVQSVTVTAPPATAAGVMFSVLGSAALHNNGPDGDVNVDTTLTIVLPADCTITNGLTVLVTNRSVPMSVPVTVSRAWNATCTQVGAHQFTVDAAAATSPGQALSDPNPSNNSGSGSGATTVN